MSGGGDFISEESLFGFDDVFGDGKSCLQVGDALRALSPNGESGRRESKMLFINCQGRGNKRKKNAKSFRKPPTVEQARNYWC